MNNARMMLMKKGYSEDQAITILSTVADFGITQVTHGYIVYFIFYIFSYSYVDMYWSLAVSPPLSPCVCLCVQVVDGNWGAHVTIPKFAIMDSDITATTYQSKVATGTSMPSSASHAHFGGVFSILLTTFSALFCLAWH